MGSNPTLSATLLPPARRVVEEIDPAPTARATRAPGRGRERCVTISSPHSPSQPIPRPQTGHPADASFYDAAETYLEEMMRLNPYVATYLGYHRYDALTDNMTPDGVAAKTSFYEDARRRFGAVDRASLSPGAAVDLDLIRTDIDSALFSLTELKAHTNDPQVYNDIIGYGTLYLTILEPGSPRWPQRLDALVSRIRALPGFLAAARANLGRPARVVTEFIIEQNRGNIAFFRDTLPPLFAAHPALKKDLEEVLPAALDALQGYQTFLEGELRGRSDGDWRLGKALWSRKLNLALQSDLDPASIVRRAWDHLKAERQAMLERAEPLHARWFPSHAHGERGDERINAIVSEVVNEASRRHSTPDKLLGDCRRWVERIKTFIREKDLITLPPDSDNFVIEPTPAFLDGMAVAFFNPAPAFEPDLKKSYWVSSIPKTGNPEVDAKRAESYLREYNDYGLQNLSIHEAFPGHYVQFHYALASPMASIYKKVFASGTFAEGWAVLCEEQMFQQGYAAEEPEAMLIHKKMSLRAPINAILDAQLHTEAMPDEEADRWALELMRRYGFQEEAEALGKLRRAKVSSTQLSTYFVGYIELLDLMHECRRRQGDRFRLKDFNETLLSYGTIPPRAVRRLMLSD
ncbi:MAG TPA: DUF885 domain-containing protein [Candidatus Polarisedimenticolia bacterium]|nr:DUF885 domain-containing protein [Candidatus Polarisedimenticolia bacterium]